MQIVTSPLWHSKKLLAGRQTQQRPKDVQEFADTYYIYYSNNNQLLSVDHNHKKDCHSIKLTDKEQSLDVFS